MPYKIKQAYNKTYNMNYIAKKSFRDLGRKYKFRQTFQ